MVKKIKSVKKTDNKKTDNKKTDNKKTITIIIFCIIVSVSVLYITFVVNTSTTTPSTTTPSTTTPSTTTPSTTTPSTTTPSTTTPSTTTPSTTTPNTSVLMTGYLEDLSLSHTFFISQNNPYFDHYLSQNDFIRFQNGMNDPNDGAKLTFKESISAEFLERMTSESNSVVIYPIFTSAAYQPNGFYSYFAGNCNESCITDLNFDYSRFDFSGSGFTAQILVELGYAFLTDIDVDKNPELLKNYDTVILLHNEYVTKNQFDAISSHPNLIFLSPNALYAEIDVNYDNNTMTLIRGHNYPEKSIANGFDYEIEERFHKYEYVHDCLEWEFVEIENGYHLNCYPDAVITEKLEILMKLKELLNSD